MIYSYFPDLELCKLSRRRAVPTVEMDFSSQTEAPQDKNPPQSLDLPHPILSPRALTNSNEKLSYMDYLELQCLSEQEKQGK